MKRVIGVLLALSLMLLCFGCGDDGSIELTKDNYEEYLKVTARCFTSGNKSINNHSYYDSVTGTVDVEGVSSNFNYKDVTVSVRIAGSYYVCDSDGHIEDSQGSNGRDAFDETINVKCDISGSGSGEATKELNERSGVALSVWYTTDQFIEAGYDVVDVKGKVVPAK